MGFGVERRWEGEGGSSTARTWQTPWQTLDADVGDEGVVRVAGRAGQQPGRGLFREGVLRVI